jgi:hypothetical protein
MVCHFVSDSHEVMTALIVVLPLIVVVEISLQLHESLLLVIMCEDDVHIELHIFLHHLLVVHSTREGGCSLIVCPFYAGHILIWKRSFVCRVHVMWKCVRLYPQAKGCFKTANATSSGN